ncbi:MAG: YncE family protein [Flavobacteriales bacterium]
MKKVVFVLFLIYQGVMAQNVVNQVLLLNEGRYDYTTGEIETPVTIGSYDPVTSIYTAIDTIEGARFASDMLIDGDYFYVAADTQLLKYDLNTYELLASQSVTGVRNILIVNDNLFVSRGEYGVSFDSYFQIYSKSDLTFISELDTTEGPKWTTQNMVHNDNKLYVAINNGFEWGNEKSLIGVLDLSTLSYLEEIDLGSDATNPDNMMITDDYIFTVNNKNWSGASFSKVDLSTHSSTTINVSDVSTGCGTSCLRGDKINFQISMDSVLLEWDPATLLSSGNPLGINQNFYELAYDEVNNYLYASETDYSTYGKVHIYDADNNLVSEFDCGVSPGTIVFDVRNTTSIEDFSFNKTQDDVFFDLFGRKINQIENQPKGVYILSGKKIFRQ